MKSLCCSLLAVLLAALPAVAFVQTAPPPPAAIAAGVVAARQKSDSLLRQYTWNSRVDVLKAGTVQETKIEQVNVLPGGQLQYVVLNDAKAPLPVGFLRRIGAENERKQMDTYLHGLHELVGKYTLPGSATIGGFLGGAMISTGTAPDGTTTLTTTGAGVVVPGDSLTYTFDAKTFAALRVDFSTTYNGDAVTVTTTFRTLPNGLTYPQYSTVNSPAKQLVVQIHNYDYRPND